MPDTFDMLLNRRAVPHARSNLAEQIIENALTKKPARAFALRDFGRAFADLFALPQPALVFAGVLMFGLTIGIGYVQNVQTDDLAARELSSFITANNGFSGDFL